MITIAVLHSLKIEHSIISFTDENCKVQSNYLNSLICMWLVHPLKSPNTNDILDFQMWLSTEETVNNNTFEKAAGMQKTNKGTYRMYFRCARSGKHLACFVYYTSSHLTPFRSGPDVVNSKKNSKDSR